MTVDLTGREYDVVKGLAELHSHKLVAERLGISRRTCEAYAESAARKIGGSGTIKGILGQWWWTKGRRMKPPGDSDRDDPTVGNPPALSD